MNRRYGIQIYQPIKVFIHDELSINFGVWYWCDNKSINLEKRVYLTPDYKNKILKPKIYKVVIWEFCDICANLVGAVFLVGKTVSAFKVVILLSHMVSVNSFVGRLVILL